jgi:hypothetical protein
MARPIPTTSTRARIAPRDPYRIQIESERCITTRRSVAVAAAARSLMFAQQKKEDARVRTSSLRTVRAATRLEAFRDDLAAACYGRRRLGTPRGGDATV